MYNLLIRLHWWFIQRLFTYSEADSINMQLLLLHCVDRLYFRLLLSGHPTNFFKSFNNRMTKNTAFVPNDDSIPCRATVIIYSATSLFKTLLERKGEKKTNDKLHAMPLRDGGQLSSRFSSFYSHASPLYKRQDWTIPPKMFGPPPFGRFIYLRRRCARERNLAKYISFLAFSLFYPTFFYVYAVLLLAKNYFGRCLYYTWLEYDVWQWI